MADVVALELGWSKWNQWRELAQVVRGLQELDGNWSDGATLRRGIELAIRIGELLGADPAWTGRLRSLLTNDALWEVVQSIVRFVASWEEGPPRMAMQATSGSEVWSTESAALEVEAQSLAVWLPVVLQLISLWRAVRGGR